jgi:hypothetical protein
MKANTNIFIHENIDRQKFDWADYRDDFDRVKILDFIDFKELLLEKGYGRVDLKYINLSSVRAKEVVRNIDVELLTRDDYNWLTTFDWGKSKYIEAVTIDKRMLAA